MKTKRIVPTNATAGPPAVAALGGAIGLISRQLLETHAAAIAPLAVRPRDAAAMLGISVSSLERLTKAGEIPRFKDGNKVLYRVASLDAWLARRETCESGGVP